jgi:hypothetical protein
MPEIRKAWIGWWVDGYWCPTETIRDNWAAKRAGELEPGEREHLQETNHRLTSTLEGVAHFAPGRAGVVATDELVALGIWSPTVEREARLSPLEKWLLRGAPMPSHDGPINREALQTALLTGTVEFVLDS